MCFYHVCVNILFRIFAGVSLRVEPVVFGQVLLCWLHGSDLEAMLLSQGHGTF